MCSARLGVEPELVTSISVDTHIRTAWKLVVELIFPSGPNSRLFGFTTLGAHNDDASDRVRWYKAEYVHAIESGSSSAVIYIFKQMKVQCSQHSGNLST
jgi:hypothetical protein